MSKMTPEQAKRILNISEDDDKAEIRKKYHRLMSAHHPDAAGSDAPEHVRRAQEINAAYSVLKKEVRTGPKKKKEVWQGEVNAKAFCDRNIYLYYSMDIAEERLYYQETRGKYMWNPGEEEFELFLASIRHASGELLEQTEESIFREMISRHGVSGQKCFLSWKEEPSFEREKFQFQARLFWNLSMQFIRPAAALQKLAEPVSRDGQGRAVYRFRGFLGAEGRSRRFQAVAELEEGEVIYPEAFEGNKIRVRNGGRNSLGYLSLEEDALYFCVIPLLKRRLAQVKMTVKEVKVNRKTRPFKAKAQVDFYFRVEKEADIDTDNGSILETADILREYEAFLKRITES